MTSRDSRNTTSSPAAESGRSPAASPDGPTADLFGQPLVPASHSARPVKGQEPMIQGICGRTYIGSTVPPAEQDSGFLFSWESRLRERLAMIGSTESALIWREKKSPAGLLISRLARSTLHTNGPEIIGQPSMKQQWPTPTNSRGGVDLRDRPENNGANLATAMVQAQWSSPRASDGEKGAPLQKFSGGGQPLPAQIYANAEKAMWVTPSARDGKDTPGMATEGESLDGDQIALEGMEKRRQRDDQLPRQMNANFEKTMRPTPKASAAGETSRSGDRKDEPLMGGLMRNLADTRMWPTPTSLSFKDSHQPGNSRSSNKMLELASGTELMAATDHGGPTPAGSSATTGRPAGSPNPAFPCWLMGLSDEWLRGVLSAMRSRRLQRRKSSRPSTT